MLRSPFLLLLTGLLCFACVSPQDRNHKLEGLSDVQQNALQTAEVILLGETHDNPWHHALQASIVDSLGASGKLGAVIFEQVSWTDQGILDRLTRDNLNQLAQKLQWDKSGWPPFALYEPIFAKALEHGAKLVAGGLPKDRIKGIYKQGLIVAFSDREQAEYELNAKLSQVAEHRLHELIFEAHCKMIPKDHALAMVPVQRARDGALVRGWKREAPSGKTSIFILGAGHARKDFGVPTYLRMMKPGIRLWSLLFKEEGTSAEPEDAYDQIYLTPAQARPDQCAELKKTLEKGAPKKPPGQR